MIRREDIADKRHRNLARLVDLVEVGEAWLVVDDNSQLVAGAEDVGARADAGRLGQRRAVGAAGHAARSAEQDGKNMQANHRLHPAGYDSSAARQIAGLWLTSG